MNPNDAAEMLRNEAECITRMIQHMKSKKSSDFLKKDLLNWLFITLQQHADFKILMADFVFRIGQVYPELQLTTTTVTTLYEQTGQDLDEQADMEVPPFDADFWMGLGDV